MYKIITFTPVFGRHDILKKMILGVKRLMAYNPEKYSIQPFFIVSNPDDEVVIKAAGFDYLYYKNNPLGEKKNAGIQYVMKNYKFDYLIEIGSDDLISNEYLDFIEPYLKAKTELFNPSLCAFFDFETKQTAIWEAAMIGAGRCISFSALRETLTVPFVFNQALAGSDFSYTPKQSYHLNLNSANHYRALGYGDYYSGMEFILWNNFANRGMDTFSTQTFERIGIHLTTISTPEPLVIDIKSDANLNKFNVFIPRIIDPRYLQTHFPELTITAEPQPAAKSPTKKKKNANRAVK